MFWDEISIECSHLLSSEGPITGVQSLVHEAGPAVKNTTQGFVRNVSSGCFGLSVMPAFTCVPEIALMATTT